MRGQVLPILIGLVVGILLAGAQNLIALGYAGSNIFTLFTSIDQYLLIFINTSFWLNILVVFLFWVILFRRIQTALGSYAAIVLMAIISVLISRFTLVLISSLSISGVNPDLVVSLPSFRTELWMLGVGLSWGILLGVVYQATKNMWMAAAMYAFYPVFAIAGKPVLNYTPFMPESGLFPRKDALHPIHRVTNCVTTDNRDSLPDLRHQERSHSPTAAPNFPPPLGQPITFFFEG